MDATGLPHFELSRAVPLDAGALVLTLSNMFGVAMGNEPVSVQKGTISTITQLDARRGAYETPYRGPVYVLDVTTNNSGAAGGAVVTREGELAAMLGKELRNTRNNTWLNYAIPIVELRASVEAIRTGKYVATTEDAATRRPARPLNLASLGIDLVPDVLERTPPYVDRVSMGLPAARAGVRPDDLIVMVNDQLIQSCKILRAAVETIDADYPVKITVLRGQTMMEFSLQSANASGSHKEQR
jgi:serine protease Do